MKNNTNTNTNNNNNFSTKPHRLEISENLKWMKQQMSLTE